MAKWHQLSRNFLAMYGDLIMASPRVRAMDAEHAARAVATDALMLQFVMGGFAQLGLDRRQDAGLQDEMNARMGKNKAAQGVYEEHRGLQVCAQCGRGEPVARMFKKCGKCGGVKYCSADCQLCEWPLKNDP